MRVGPRGGVAVAVAAIVLYHLANPRVFSLQYEQVDVVQVVLFVAVALTSAKLSNDSRRLHRLANTDDLTGLHNLRSFEAHLRRLVGSSIQSATPLSLLVLDLDRLKSLNDVHGHLAGAEAVRTVGLILAERLPADAVACRYGGDEFAIVLPACTETLAHHIAEDLRDAVNTRASVLAGTAFPAGTLSISVGVAARRPEQRDVSDTSTAADDAAGEALFREADAALYEAKRHGRNRVSAALESVRVASRAPLSG